MCFVGLAFFFFFFVFKCLRPEPAVPYSPAGCLIPNHSTYVITGPQSISGWRSHRACTLEPSSLWGISCSACDLLGEGGQEGSWTWGPLQLLPFPGFISVTQGEVELGQIYRLVSGLGCLYCPSHHLFASGHTTSQERCGHRPRLCRRSVACFCLLLFHPSFGHPVSLCFIQLPLTLLRS